MILEFMMQKKPVVLFIFFFTFISAFPAVFGTSWKDEWILEAESSKSKVLADGQRCLEIMAPKGLTLWYRKSFSGDVTVEYDVQVVMVGANDRLSDLNSFFMASDPQVGSVFVNAKVRGGVFSNQKSLQMYYLGYGGNYNTTTRFRRYDGVNSPPVLREYTDKAHLLKPNHWYHIKIVKLGKRIRYYFDGECIVDYVDSNPLRKGWFGFRTTLSHTRIANFRYFKSNALDVQLHWVDNTGNCILPQTFGVPFNKGEIKASQLCNFRMEGSDLESWINARWQDGSVKWAAFAVNNVADRSTTLRYIPRMSKSRKGKMETAKANSIVVNTGSAADGMLACFSRKGEKVMDSIVFHGKKIIGSITFVVSTTQGPFCSFVDTCCVERSGIVRSLVRVRGHVVNDRSKMTLPFTLRFYFYHGSRQIRITNNIVFDGMQDKDFVKSIGLRIKVPLREQLYNRQVAFAIDSTIWMEPVQPLDGRRELDKRHNYEIDQMNGIRVPEYASFDEKQRNLIDSWATWNGYRLSQLTDEGFSLRKCATEHSPYIGTLTGRHGEGFAFVGDVSGGIGISMNDFWQSYPSSIQIDDATSDEATVTMWLWSPESEPMDLRHYDVRAHNLDASYEDVQQGMSTPFGVGRSSAFTLKLYTGYPGKEELLNDANTLSSEPQLLPTPEYLHDKEAFGIWSLRQVESTDTLTRKVEGKLDWWLDTYKKAVEDFHWYGFWNYGDFMHGYDPERATWRYDVGGYAWDNTELASPDWLWYSFLRSGRSDIWRMAVAMTRHNSEVDTYHIGIMKGLGSRHNVSHWGCGAKEARISQSAFSRFLYYLTSDERLGDIMHDETDADQKLYEVDPMRLAEPRSQYPCSAPARLRFGPDWLAYAGNWMTEWERTGNRYYRNKIETGMKSMAAFPDGIFTGNLAKGYNPATGIISYDGDPTQEKTNHLMTIMGGFEIMNELRQMIHVPAFETVWLDFAKRYKEKAKTIMHNHFPVRRLEAFAASSLGDEGMKRDAWQSLFRDMDAFSTNDAALWSLDAIYMLEVLRR